MAAVAVKRSIGAHQNTGRGMALSPSTSSQSTYKCGLISILPLIFNIFLFTKKRFKEPDCRPSVRARNARNKEVGVRVFVVCQYRQYNLHWSSWSGRWPEGKFYLFGHIWSQAEITRFPNYLAYYSLFCLIIKWIHTVLTLFHFFFFFQGVFWS